MTLLVEPYDESNIGPDDLIIRRINPQFHVIWDENRQRYRIASKAYSKSSTPKGGMSVDIEALINAAGIDPKSYVTTPVFTAAVAFYAKDVRVLDLIVGYEPIVGVPGVLDNPFHGEVWTKRNAKKFSAGEVDGLRKAAKWYVELPDVDIL